LIICLIIQNWNNFSCKSDALWSYHFNTASPNNGFWEQKLSWWTSPGDPEVSSFPQDAYCMSIHLNGKFIAFGSKRVDLALVPLLSSQSEHPFQVGQKPAEIKSAMHLAII